MSPKSHTRLSQVFLVLNAVFWLAWGLINLLRPEALSGALMPNLVVYDLSIAPGQYSQAALAMYEIPITIFSWLVYSLQPRGR